MRFLITAGPTREYLDPVRFLSNAASGRIGCALAEGARRRGHEVRLVLGPVAIAPPRVDELVWVTSAAEMHDAVLDRLGGCDVLIAAAAVCDYRPKERAEHKLKKGDGPLHLVLERTPDILADAAARRREQVLVGFCLESEDLEARAQAKREAKKLDLIVANSPAAVAAERQDALLLDARGEITRLENVTKEALAEAILDRVRALV